MPKGKEERAKEAHLEEKAFIAEKMKEQGLGFEAHELPPLDEEGDKALELQVKRTFLQSLMALYPGSDEAFEGAMAEEEMDNLQKIEIEKAKAQDLLALTKIGRHEEALETMMAETNNDFFFFNKLKHQMELDGKFKYLKPNLNPFAELEKGKGRNRIRKGATLGFAMHDEKTAEVLAKMNNAAAAADKGKQKKLLKANTPCLWKGKNKTGDYLECTNYKFTHPYKTVTDEDKKEVPLVLPNCAYHTPDCVGEMHKEAAEPIKIKDFNKEALCTECYVNKTKKKPVQLKAELCPGVKEVSILVSKLEQKGKSEEEREEEFKEGLDADGHPLSEDSRCAWRPNSTQKDLKGYICRNKVFKNPETGAILRFCANHIKVCVKHHPAGNDAILVPNLHALCTMHHIDIVGAPPIPLPYPPPGVGPLIQKAAWQIDVGHWAAPQWRPDQDVDAEEFYRVTLLSKLLEIEDMDDACGFLPWCLESVVYRIKYTWKYWRYRNRKAKLIQRCFRRYRWKQYHVVLKHKRSVRLRNAMTLRIQCLIRRFNSTCQVDHRRKAFNAAALVWQKHFRGYRCRVFLRQDISALKITKFFKKTRFLKFKDAVVVIMQLRLSFNKRVTAVTQIQRICRGYLVRYKAFVGKLFEFIMKRSVKIIQKRVRRWLKKKNIKYFVYPSEKWALARLAPKLAQLIYELYIDRHRRAAVKAQMVRHAPTMQRVARAFLAASGTKKVKVLRKALRTWLQPKFAVEFMQSFLDSRMFWMNQKKDDKVIVIKPKKVEVPCYVRKFLPDDKVRDQEVSEKVFVVALRSWYKSIETPLLKSEMDALVKRFRNPASSQINVTTCDIYISLHDLPCRIHGRKVCGDCHTYEKCMITSNGKKCGCEMYKASTPLPQSICKDCNHPPSWHRLCPLQKREAYEKPKGMLEIMDEFNDKKPDLSMPEEVQGLELDDIFVPPIDPNLARYEHEVAITNQTNEYYLQTYLNRSLAKKLSLGEFESQEMYDNDEYWENTGRNINMLSPSKEDPRNMNMLEVGSYNVAPNYEVSAEIFWANTDKNPNKRPRDYHELFEHNMPMAVVDIPTGTLTYTIEGSKIYLNLLNEIIKMNMEVHHDNPAFLRLVVSHVQIFERHWRKMVADIRRGKLDRNLPVPKTVRTAFESMNLPRPDLSKRLDSTFRMLGFHKKVLGKDIKVTKYAELRVKPVVDPKARRPSLSITPGHTPLHGERPRGNSPSGRVSPGGSPPKLRPVTPLSPLQSREGSRKPSTPKKKAMQLIGEAFSADLVGELRQQEKLQSIRGPVHHSRGERRGSDSDILRPASKQELQEYEYEHETAPRDNYHLVQMSGTGKYVCPFPACGKSFLSRDAAFAHLPVHEQRTKLSAPTPLPDSHLNFYWPSNVPWMDAPKYVERALPPGSIPCPIANCNKTFSTKERLQSHIRIEHALTGPSHILKGYFNLEGTGISVPPFPCPPNSPLLYCPYHLNPLGKCPLCVECEAYEGPRQPYKFYDSISINMQDREKKALGKKAPTITSSSVESAGTDTVLCFRRNDTAVGIVYDSHGERTVSEAKAVCHAIIVDKFQNCWICVRILYNYEEAKQIAVEKGIKIPRDFERQYELVYAPYSEGKVALKDVKWIPVVDVVSTFNLYYSTRYDFKVQLKSGEITRHNSYFVRTVSEASSSK